MRFLRKIALYLELTKPRICLMALIMATVGYYLGARHTLYSPSLFLVWLGLGLVGGGCGALNQYLEREEDAKMWRTMNRPLPSGRLKKESVLVFGLILSVLGELILVIGVNSVTAVLAGVTILTYLGIYTPSKRISSLSTLIGAIPGALPPLMGWTAATGLVGMTGFLLFVILFIWQIPHFLAIAILYKEDYRRAGMPILSVVDRTGEKTSRHIMFYSIVLLPLSLLPNLWGVAGDTYLLGVLLLGVGFLYASYQVAFYPSIRHAKQLFIASLCYLPTLSLLLLWDRI